MKRSNGQISDDKLTTFSKQDKNPKFNSHASPKPTAVDADQGVYRPEKVLEVKVKKLTSLITELSDHIESLREDVKFYQRKEREVIKNVDQGAAAVKQVLSATSANKFKRDDNIFVPFEDGHLLPATGYLPAKIDVQDIYKLYVLLAENELFEQDAVEMQQTIERRDKRIIKLKTKIEEHDSESVEQNESENKKDHPKSSGDTHARTTIENSEISPNNNGTHLETPAVITAKKAKRDQAQLAQTRLDEINKYQDLITDLKSESVKRKQTSTYNTAQNQVHFLDQYTSLVGDAEKVRNIYEKNRQEFTSQWLQNFNVLNEIESQDALIAEMVKCQVLHFEQESVKLKRENDALKLENDQVQAYMDNDEILKKEIRHLIESFLINLNTLKKQINRNIDMVDKYGTICDEQVVKKDDKSKETADVEDGEVEEVDEGTAEEHAELEEELAGVKMLLECYKSQPKDVREKVKAMCDELKLKRELKEIQEKVKLAKQSQNKCKYVKDLQKCFDILQAETERLEVDVDGIGDGYEAVDAQSKRLKHLDKTTSDMHLIGQNKKHEVEIKKYENEREILMKQVHTHASEYEASYDLITAADKKELTNMGLLEEHNNDIGQRTAKLDMTRRKLIETALLAKAQHDEIERLQESLDKTDSSDEVAAVKNELRVFQKINTSYQKQIHDLEHNLEKLNKKQIKKEAGTPHVDVDQLKQEVAEMESKLNCPICHKREKDAILETCKHAFCYKCIEVRYETRQRKCPKCSQAFGKNQYHRIDLNLKI
jgi:E3 ubiquitin-protein ligase BRE1